MNEYAIIVAGGKGTRMKSKVAKQFMPLQGVPILVHTIKAFIAYNSQINIVLVLPHADVDTWKDISQSYDFSHLPIIIGGESRFQSVKNGLNSIRVSDGLVAIHDGVRPLVSTNMIEASFRLAAQHGSAVAAVPLKESLRRIQHKEAQGMTTAVDRSAYRLVQTPQTFQLDLIKKAYSIQEESELTDDASVAERSGHKIWLYEGSYTNIKITTPEDILIAESLINQ